MPLFTRDRNGNVQAAADQIVWAGDTNLYRSAADTLRTDDSLIVGAVLSVLGAAAFSGAVTGLTRATVGLGSVDNTADTAKPVSAAAQTALDLKAPLASPAFTGTVTGVGKAAVGLGNVDNTADAAKPVSTAGQTALDLKAPLASPAFTGTVTGLTKTTVGLGNVDNTADASKPVSTAAQTALDLKAPLASPTFTGTVAGVTKAAVGLGNVDNTADTAKPVSTAQAAADALRVLKAGDTLTGLLALAAGLAGVGGLTIGTDVNLYRSAADTLATDDKLTLLRNAIGPSLVITNTTVGGSAIQSTTAAAGYNAFDARLVGDTGIRLGITGDGKLAWGAGVAGVDTSLYRSGVGQLYCPDSVYVGTTLVSYGTLVSNGVFKPGRFTTALRPSAATAGQGGMIFDTTLNRPIWSTGSAWVDAAGVAV